MQWELKNIIKKLENYYWNQNYEKTNVHRPIKCKSFLISKNKKTVITYRVFHLTKLSYVYYNYLVCNLEKPSLFLETNMQQFTLKTTAQSALV